MKLSYKWLKEYIDIDLSAEELAEILTMSGSAVETITEKGGDKVLSLEITSNRPDCLSVTGIAREICALTGNKVKYPDSRVTAAGKSGKAIKCEIKAPGLCPRYTARVVTGVKVKGLTPGVSEHIVSVDMRPVNNIVDITNFCLMELGQPMHAFDLDKIEGGKVIIREAEKGEKILTIDGVERELEAGMLVIADQKQPIAIAGVMGGKETEVTGTTKNILLESAYFDPVSVRRTARKLALSSDASYRFERGVDKEGIVPASDRAAALIVEKAGGTICEMYDVGSLARSVTEIELDAQEVSSILGATIPGERIEAILRALGMDVEVREKGQFKIKVPSSREDITAEIDLVEEIARIYGYDNIPARCEKITPEIERKDRTRRIKDKIKVLLPAAGVCEIMTYSLISEEAAGRFPCVLGRQAALTRYMSEEHKVLTPQLVHGMVRAFSWNVSRKNKDLGFFELGKLYAPEEKGAGYMEVPALCIGLTGLLRQNWKEGAREATLFDLKGIVEEMLHGLGLEVAFGPADKKGFSVCSSLSIPGQEDAGFMGEIDARIADMYDITQPVHIAQIRLDGVFKTVSLEKRVRPIPRFPFSVRDVSVLCDKDIPAARLFSVIRSSGGELLVDAGLVDMYEGEHIGSGKKSLTFSIKYGLGSRTLTEDEIEGAHAKVKEELVRELNVTFR
ncbi:MAG: phenylalanine--tRNA ligase subunit beta [Candidatus Omnitrophica bacterium]|nr:phenylalanine--tRNA ligase subunit beta [Candidatus Omnitrophota bacterium]MDD5488317.1 phenylalanine--tRNA ligase subunit beta [Candidatus Omnitrophota bacterium]